MSDSGIVDIRGKSYNTVAKRVADFREKHPDFTIETDVQSNTDVVVLKAFIKDNEGRVLATGYAEEVRGSTNINKTSALENCETSAVGRALAFYGFGGTEIASANEVSNAIIQQAKQEVADFFIKMNRCIDDNMTSVLEIKNSIVQGVLSNGAEAWFELSEEDQKTLFVAPSKGGIFTTKEREVIKSKEFREAYYGPTEETA